MMLFKEVSSRAFAAILLMGMMVMLFSACHRQACPTYGNVEEVDLQKEETTVIREDV